MFVSIFDSILLFCIHLHVQIKWFNGVGFFSVMSVCFDCCMPPKEQQNALPLYFKINMGLSVVANLLFKWDKQFNSTRSPNYQRLGECSPRQTRSWESKPMTTFCKREIVAIKETFSVSWVLKRVTFRVTCNAIQHLEITYFFTKIKFGFYLLLLTLTS